MLGVSILDHMWSLYMTHLQAKRSWRQFNLISIIWNLLMWYLRSFGSSSTARLYMAPHAVKTFKISSCMVHSILCIALIPELFVILLTRCAVIHQSSQCFAISPVPVKVVDGYLWHLVLDPAQKALFGRQFPGIFIVLILPHWHGNRVVQDKGPYHAQDELQVAVHNSFTICNERESVLFHRWSINT